MTLAKAYGINCSPACERLLAFTAERCQREACLVAEQLASDCERSAERLALQIEAEAPERLQELLSCPPTAKKPANIAEALLEAVRRLNKR